MSVSKLIEKYEKKAKENAIKIQKASDQGHKMVETYYTGQQVLLSNLIRELKECEEKTPEKMFTNRFRRSLP